MSGGSVFPTRPIGLGVIGLGRAFVLMLPTLLRHPGVRLVAATDPRTGAAAAFANEFGGCSYESSTELCGDPRVEAVYIASPHQFHHDQALLALERGKHVLVEKPMALDLEQCAAMVEASERTGRHLLIGHSHSFDAPVLRARQLIESGSYGALRMITAINFTDFLYRPRRPEELDTARGGGVVWSQGAHQIDVVRLLAGGLVRSVRATTGVWDPARRSESAYNALLTFENGVSATLTYSGHAHFDTDEFCDWISEMGFRRDPKSYGSARAALKGRSAQDEIALKNARTYGSGLLVSAKPPEAYNHFGFVLASCEGADLRVTAEGVRIYSDEEHKYERLTPPAIPRAEVIDELWAAVVLNRRPVHDGAWGLATIESCQAILQSARETREIRLKRQVPPGDKR